MSEPKSLLLVGKVRPERKRSLNGMAVAADLPLVALEESSEAIGWLDSNDPGCVVVDASASRLDRLIAKIRSKPQLSHVPVLSLVSAPDEIWIEQYFGWGGDDIVPIDAGATLLQRLKATPRQVPNSNAERRVLLADPDKARIEVLSRVFSLAGFSVTSVLDRGGLESRIEESAPAVVVASSALGRLTELIEVGQRTGQGNAWIVTAARRELDQQQSALGPFERCIAIGAQSNPWQILYRANELMRRGGERRGEPRYLFGSFVLFRSAGSDDDDIGVAYNLGSRGMFVRTFAPVLSDDVWLEWRVPHDKTRVRLEGRVAWRQVSLSDSNRPPSPLGFGVEFQDYLGGARRHLERTIEVLDTAFRRSQSNRPGSGEHAVAGTTSSKPPPPSRGPLASQSVKSGQSQSPIAGMATKGTLGIKPLSAVSIGGRTSEPSRLPAQPSPKDTSFRGSDFDSRAGAGGLGGLGSETGQTPSNAPTPNPPPTRQPTRTLPSKITAPPRPTSVPSGVLSPPRNDREGIAVSNGPSDTVGHRWQSPNALDKPLVEEQGPAVRRHDTLREHAAFTDLAEKTDPSAERELEELGPDSSQPTEILAQQLAMLDSLDDHRHPVFTSSDDAPTVVTNRLAPAMDAAFGEVDAVAAPRPADVPKPNSMPEAQALASADDGMSKPWAAPGVEPPSISTEYSFSPRRRGRGILVTSIVFAVVAVATAAVVVQRSRSSEPGDAAPSSSLSGKAAVEPGLPPAQPPQLAPSAEASQLQESDASIPPTGSGIAPNAKEIPWAKIDDGSPLPGFPPVEDFQPGKAGRLLADHYGYLIVRFPEPAFIFSDNIAMGATNWKIATPCGDKTLRIGVGEKPTTWLSDEARVKVACRETTQVIIKRLEGVVVPPGATRPIAPGSLPARKSSAKGPEIDKDAQTGEPQPKRTPSEASSPSGDPKPKASDVTPTGGEGRPNGSDREPQGSESGVKPAEDGKPKAAEPGAGESPRGLVDTRE